MNRTQSAFYRNLKQKRFGGARPIQDAEAIRVLDRAQASRPLSEVLQDKEVVDKFLVHFRSWFLSSSRMTVRAHEQFPTQCFTQGTTQAFDMFYAKHNSKRFRCFRGEYVYHLLSCRNHYPDQFVLVEDEELKPGDALLVSLPFADSGNPHPVLEETLRACDKLKIPVFLDLAYAPMATGLEINLNHQCIEVVGMSLSKVFPVAHLRIGVRWTREDDDDPILFMQKTGYQNRFSAHVGLDLIQSLSAHFILDKYLPLQIQLCEHLEIEPSRTVFFGLGGEEWSEYSRAGTWNRLFLGGELERLQPK